MTLQEQARQSGLVLVEDTVEWNERDWPPLEGAGRIGHASVVLDHPDTNDNNNNNNNNKRQTVVVLGGYQQGQNVTNSVLVLNLADPDKQWREGPPMNKIRYGHAAVVCNGCIYVMGGYKRYSSLNCMERMDANDLLQSSSTLSSSEKNHWTTLPCRLSTGRARCCAVAVHNRYIVVMGGYNDGCLSSVEIIDIRNHTVTAGPSMTVPRQWCASAVIGDRIFVVGGHSSNEHGHVLDSVEYMDFAEEREIDTLSTVISFSSSWITHSDLVLPNPRAYCAMVAVGSCLIVAGGSRRTVQVLDTHRNRVWNLPSFGNCRYFCSMVTVTNQVAVISGCDNPTCATVPLMDKNSWCFRRLTQSSGWYHSLIEGMGIHDTDGMSPFSSRLELVNEQGPIHAKMMEGMMKPCLLFLEWLTCFLHTSK